MNKKLKIDDIKSIIQPRLADAHKGDFGHAILFSGSKGMMGACVLSAKSIYACLLYTSDAADE